MMKDELLSVGDGYRNVVANLGTDRDKATGGSYVAEFHNASELLIMYRSSWLARKIVDIPAFDSIRRWRNWNAEKDDITKIENEERRLGLQKKVHAGLTLARLYGGAAIFISTKESDVSKPLSANEEITHLTVIPRQMLFGDLTQTDITSSRFGLPIFYTVNSTGISMDTGGQQKIHHSRLVKFTGAEIPWGDTQIHEDWGDSVLTATMDAIRRADSTAANIASLVFEAKVDVIHVPKLMQLISTPEGEIAVKEYIRLAMHTKGVNGALILDGGDTTKSENESGGTRYDSKSASFAGLDSVFDRFLQAVSGAADIPATRLLGQAPAGMNATGESDLRNYYDHIQSIQTIELGPEMAMLDEMLVRQATGKGMGEIWYDWRPLWQPTDEQKLAAGKQVAGIVGDMAKLRLWPDEVLSKAGANAMVETGALPGLEAAIDEWTNEEGDLFVEPEAGEGEPDMNRVPPAGSVVSLEGRQKRANVKDHNPYHDPATGRFTTGPSGSSALTEAFGYVSESAHSFEDVEVIRKHYEQKAKSLGRGDEKSAYDVVDQNFENGLQKAQRESVLEYQANVHYSNINGMLRDENFGMVSSQDISADLWGEPRKPRTADEPFRTPDREFSNRDAAIKHYSTTIERLDSAFVSSQGKVSKDTVLYRGVGEAFMNSALDQPVGSVFRDKGYTSTTPDAKMAVKFGILSTPRKLGGVMLVKVRKGQTAMALPKVDSPKESFEVLLPRESSYRIVESNRETRTIVVEVIDE